jgi:hypothetical protein
MECTAAHLGARRPRGGNRVDRKRFRQRKGVRSSQGIHGSERMNGEGGQTAGGNKLLKSGSSIGRRKGVDRAGDSGADGARGTKRVGKRSGRKGERGEGVGIAGADGYWKTRSR